MKPVYLYALLAAASIASCDSRREEPQWKGAYGADTLDYERRRALQDSLFRAQDSIAAERWQHGSDTAQSGNTALPQGGTSPRPGTPAAAHADGTSGSHPMRGFDPPSEDDMDDNGMSRFMENNDEEGWY
ncbi:MAG: hypothetical protein IJ722_01090 [Alloprevotella sp.]|nr:hypothetical protein [Alloprevotella sp.]